MFIFIEIFEENYTTQQQYWNILFKAGTGAKTEFLILFLKEEMKIELFIFLVKTHCLHSKVKHL